MGSAPVRIAKTMGGSVTFPGHLCSTEPEHKLSVAVSQLCQTQHPSLQRYFFLLFACMFPFFLRLQLAWMMGVWLWFKTSDDFFFLFISMMLDILEFTCLLADIKLQLKKYVFNLIYFKRFNKY
jgi:hypothetical protein